MSVTTTCLGTALSPPSRCVHSVQPRRRSRRSGSNLRVVSVNTSNARVLKSGAPLPEILIQRHRESDETDERRRACYPGTFTPSGGLGAGLPRRGPSRVGERTGRGRGQEGTMRRWGVLVVGGIAGGGGGLGEGRGARGFYCR